MSSPPSLKEIQGIGLRNGLDSIGIAKAEIFESTLKDLQHRKSQNLHAGMSFTYRNPKRSANPKKTMPEGQSLIVGAKSYWQPPSESAKSSEPMGRVALYAQQDHYQMLRVGLEAMANELIEAGFKASVLVDDNALVDREAAYRAGIGWYGKNANILIPKRGSWFVLGSILTNAAYEPNEPVDDGCGTCTKCITSCPTQAIISPGVLDANKCLAWLVQAEGDFPIEFRSALGDRIYGCDDCQEICPTNRFEERLQQANKEASDKSFVSIYEILESDNDNLLSKYGQWYIPKRDPRYLRRNALVVLGNSKTPPTPRTVKLIKRWLADDDEMLRAHTVWAAKKLGLERFLTALENDPSPSVQRELSHEEESNHDDGTKENKLVWSD